MIDVSLKHESVKNKNFLNKKIMTTYSDIAQAKPKPSNVEVPLPNSSTIIREFLVAD